MSLDIDVTRSFDNENNQSSQATGFIVDAERGIILTNRHVVTSAPVRAEALFINQEELRLTPVYRDPVHDFGFFRYDPADLRFIEPAELQLTPERAAVGLDVRIVGNDAGEQLSILSGTIARLDRRAPAYGYGVYNDFNTFYIQAATGSSGGSSGSPVLDVQGGVVALNAGASANAASSFFLPLARVKRALEHIQEGRPVTRGTLQTRFVQVAYDELQRLGLQPDTEAHYRQLFTEYPGLLVASNVLPGGAADGTLRVGDILLEINGEPLADFVTLESVLDDSVTADIQVTVERYGQRMTHAVTVADLHAITPDEYLQFGNAVVHRLSYQQSWHFNREPHGVYVASPGYVLSRAGIPDSSVIEAVAGQPVADLDDLEAVLNTLADGQAASVRFATLEEAGNVQQTILHMDRRWFPAQRCKRDDVAGEWPCRELGPGPAQQPATPVTAADVPATDRELQRIARSLVLVNFDMPYSLSGVSERHYYGTGLVVDAEQGLVIVDRNTVPESMGDVRLTFAASVEVPGRVEFVHPVHNLAVVSYDPAAIGDTPVEAARLNTVLPSAGANLRSVGLRRDNTLVSQPVQVANISALRYPLSNSLRFRETNLDAISLVTPPRGADGVLVDSRSRVVALWSSFAFDVGKDTREDSRGVPAELVAEAIDFARSGEPVYSIEAELSTLPVARARGFGLPDSWAEKLAQHDPRSRHVLTVERTVVGTAAEEMLRSGDLLLAVDGDPVTRFREIERAVRGRESIGLTIWRDDAELEILLPTMALDGRGVRRILLWGGAVLQEPYREVAAQWRVQPDGVYVAFFSYGSPASRADLVAGTRIVAVDGEAVTNLDDFIARVSERAGNPSLRLTLRGWNDAEGIVTLRPDPVYWPSWEVFHNGDWHRRAPHGAADEQQAALLLPGSNRDQ